MSRFGMPTLIDLPDLQANIDLCKQLGLTFIELNMNSPLFLPAVLPAEQLSKAGEQAGIGLTIHLPEELDLAGFEPRMRQGQVQCVLWAIDWAGNAGISLLTMHLHRGVYFTLPDRRVYLYEKHRELALANLRNSISQLQPALNARGVRLLFENTGSWNLRYMVEMVETVLTEFQRDIGLTWDVGHEAEAGYADTPVLQRYAGRIAHMHLHDFDGRSAHQPLGTGSVDITAALSFAEERGLGVVLETKSADALTASVRALRATTGA